jgi:lipid-binding SYLF domain-containing protein
MKNAIQQFSLFSAALLAALLSFNAHAAGKLDQRMADATEVIHEFTQIPESAIPDSLLANAHGVAVFPGVIKIGLGIGARFGKGVLIVRQEDGSWSNPGFVSLGGGSFGWQIGAQSTDLVLVFKDRRSINNIFNGKITLGADVAAAAGPVGRQASAATDGRLNAAIYSYARNRGLFAGISLEGAWLRMDRRSNQSYYDNTLSPEEILAAADLASPATANEFVDLMTATAPGTERPSTYQTAATTEAAPLETLDQDTGVRIYAIEPLESDYDETTF